MSDTPAFPPEEIGAFLRFCAGEWMSLRSEFALGEAEAAGHEAGEGDEWHSSERGELVVTFLEPAAGHGPGGLRVGPRNSPQRELHFSSDGRFSSGAAGTPAEATLLEGEWELWPDGSLELRLQQEGREVRERIWFTKPNLRLRSTVERQGDGSPERASFSSEIRRVSRPAAGS
ncbi:phycobiliprotein lyase [Cyanobium sp. NIES-981]|uniref:phycobiliprotein lyase n=1 Tax=Cyanobium sp. NIES-981 TaxID=1851505 RepID=UPI0007DD9271|nr:phycobiliprotein lyase [Cyanobium sp. NIES-981]SBO44394.1 Chromophore lyase CpcS/CpeS [Cyanobium sp. NIES-981]